MFSEEMMNPIKLAPTHNPFPAIQPAARRFGWLILTAWLAAGFLLVNFALPGLGSGDLNMYILQPALWTSTAVLALYMWKTGGERVNLFERRSLILMAAMIGGIQVALSVLFGLLSGFGASPYARTVIMVTLNLWFIATRLAGIETARWYLGKTVGRVNPGLGFLIAWLLPLALLVPAGKFSLLGQPEGLFPLVGQTLLPAAGENLLAATLAISAGPLASIAYLGVRQAFEWLSPILPDLPWMGAALIGVLVPVLGLIALNREEAPPAGAAAAQAAGTKKGQENASAGSWLLVAALAVGVIWLNSGFFGIRPSLISGNSMNPTYYPGDVVITRTIPPEEIQVGDIIRFRRESIDVVHRVKAIQEDASGLVFTTRGDNNNVDDEPVTVDRYAGKVILSVPKIGWVGIYFRMALAWVGGLL
jgi:signal peptidase